MQDLISTFLAPLAPKSILALGGTRWPALEDYCAEHGIEYSFHPADQRLPLNGRFDLSIAYGFENLPKQFVTEQLGVLRNLLSERVWALVLEPQQWSLMDFVALGFSRDELPDTAQLRSYSYNLETYNAQRSWNNPQFWANPHRWHIRF